MKKEYYLRLLKKLENLSKTSYIDRLSPKPKKITVRFGNKTICTLDKWESQDLYYLWKQEQTIKRMFKKLVT